jgi:putative ABC transport system permease protein
MNSTPAGVAPAIFAFFYKATAGFALVAGSVLATALLHWRLEMSPAGLYWSGLLTAAAVSSLSLGMGARYLLGQMRLNPAMLLRGGE